MAVTFLNKDPEQASNGNNHHAKNACDSEDAHQQISTLAIDIKTAFKVEDYV